MLLLCESPGISFFFFFLFSLEEWGRTQPTDMDLPDLFPVMIPHAGLRGRRESAVRLFRFALPGYHKRVLEEDIEPFVE